LSKNSQNKNEHCSSDRDAFVFILKFKIFLYLKRFKHSFHAVLKVALSTLKERVLVTQTKSKWENLEESGFAVFANTAKPASFPPST
jgi:hypothetical protein